MDVVKQVAVNFVGMLLIFGGIVAMVAIIYAAHALANSQLLIDSLVSTGYFIDVRAEASARQEAEIQRRIDEGVAAAMEREMANVSGRKNEIR